MSYIVCESHPKGVCFTLGAPILQNPVRFNCRRMVHFFDTYLELIMIIDKQRLFSLIGYLPRLICAYNHFIEITKQRIHNTSLNRSYWNLQENNYIDKPLNYLVAPSMLSQAGPDLSGTN